MNTENTPNQHPLDQHNGDQHNGLYSPDDVRDACGLGAIVQKNGQASHDLIRKAFEMARSMEHRGAVGSDPKAGDGAGISLQVSDSFFRPAMADCGVALPAAGSYAVAMLFLPAQQADRKPIIDCIESCVAEQGYSLLGWREVPTQRVCLSPAMLDREPFIAQFFLSSTQLAGAEFVRGCYILRRLLEKAVQSAQTVQPAAREDFYIASLSPHVVVYKGMLTGEQLTEYYPDLHDERYVSALALVHLRYSTNTSPTWKLAHPFRCVAHNGEINTMKGNVNHSRARGSQLKSALFGEHLQSIRPIIAEGCSDSEAFDNYFEFLMHSGRNMAQTMTLMVPEAWEGHATMPRDLACLYEYQSSLMEPWDGPAAFLFTNGMQVGAYTDRNGLRPLRYCETDDGLLIVASETGVVDLAVDQIKRKGNLGAAQMLLVDTTENTVLHNTQIKAQLAARHPYTEWVAKKILQLADIPEIDTADQEAPSRGELALAQRVFGYTTECLQFLLKPMAQNGQEQTYSMGSDTPLAILSERSKPLFDYFTQNFAQVTNPAIDPIREEAFMSLRTNLGGSQNILAEQDEQEHPIIALKQPVLLNAELERICAYGTGSKAPVPVGIIDTCYDLESTEDLKCALERICQEAQALASSGHRILVLDDSSFAPERVPISSLLATSAVHHHLLRLGKRNTTSLIVKTGEAHEIHHFACLLSYGANAVNPYLALDSLAQMSLDGDLGGHTPGQTQENYALAIDKGLKKILAKMGVSTLISYQSAQIMEAVGISSAVIRDYFLEVVHRKLSPEGAQRLAEKHAVIEGIDLERIEQEHKIRHESAYFQMSVPSGGEYSWRMQGEYHSYNPETIHLLQQSAWKNDKAIYQRFAELSDNTRKKPRFLRDILTPNFESCTPIPLEEVEPVENIIARFSSGAMSIGAISKEAHEELAIAMNSLGAKSNTGEGGEEESRFVQDENGVLRRSAIKQVASGRFGVTSHYLVNADQIQIKIAQGAKPGEGGQLPGFKVDQYISTLRHTVPGVSLISPPPHHDIYSIEDLAQLVFDLKNANDQADISVKLVSAAGVGTIAAGVAKSKADLITIAGPEGGTGATPATSSKHTGLPWEIGLAETQQALVSNKLRQNVRLQVDGLLKTGRDVIIGGLLGADDFGFSTALLVTLGCIMMRKCHLNTCPVGVATQDTELRKNFMGKADYVVNYLRFVAGEVREYMARLGVRRFEDLIGRVDLLTTTTKALPPRAKGLNLRRLLVLPQGAALHNTHKQQHQIDGVLDHKLIEKSEMALEYGRSIFCQFAICNVDRSVGTMLGSRVSRKYGAQGLPAETISVKLRGSAGQSLGAFVPAGITLTLEGDANDYVGKGLCGGKIVVYPPKHGHLVSNKNVIIGNTVLYGATSGTAFFAGIAGQRFAVRNSGATAVVEGLGDHGCEYMTGGRVVVLGTTGRNFAAGMSGGIAYILDQDRSFHSRCNTGLVALERMGDGHYADELHALITQHAELTGSIIAGDILAHWQSELHNFIMVMPHEYRRIIDAQQRRSA